MTFRRPEAIRHRTPATSTPSPTAVEPMPAVLDLRHAEREAAITRLFETHAAQFTRLAALLGAGAEAEDVVADAFCDLHRRWGRLRNPDAAPAYLRSAVCNLVRMRLRHRKVVQRHAPEQPQDASSAECEIILREDQQEVVCALRELPSRQREALVLRYWLDLREAEIAQAMGISAGSVKVHTSRGMAALTKALRGTR
jgi:RNA polymerase sigma-70 factor (sigma-E family)